MQRGEQVFRIEDPVRIGHIGQALFFDQMPLAGQHSQDAEPERWMERDGAGGSFAAFDARLPDQVRRNTR